MDVNPTDRAAHTLQPKGNLDSLNGTRLQHAIEALIQSAAHTVLVDCSELGLIDSAGLGALVLCFKALRAVDGSLILSDLNEQHQMLLSLTVMDTVFTVL